MANKNLVIIPLRANSKRLLNKNILDLGGIPLFMHSVNYARENIKKGDKIIIVTNDDLVKKIAKRNHVEVIDRPEEISGEFEPTITALQYVLSRFNKDFENVILLQATNPLRPKNLFKEALEVFNKQECKSLMTVSKSEKKLGKINNSVFKPYSYIFGQRSQDLEPLYFENGLIYISKAELIIGGKIIDTKCYPFIVDHIFSTIDIDIKEDLELANYYFNKMMHE
ncbi:N-acylneuraminate cytidylyltransferase [Polaribacter huanghezhanensis]|uniref:acylneuraminate cytidylyltransferase family protein n=1 Tax=Polaribacter huanghezhanensis TaxID=1354726 RepID=UPI0026493AEE|nr:acylneuraminate cytidylyltransferase family protein [Polaribacter huanghezhanensis]WKD86505.1 N-acylneuraminate cytidylyltransferase [Polaribacter huanghezhanensis]